jgi:hypothetical protein
MWELIFSLALSTLALNTLNEIRLGSASRHWPSVKGLIIDAYVYEDESTDPDDYPFSAKLRYSFKVNNAHYEADHIRFGGPVSRNFFREAKEDLKGYAAGHDVKVFYHPKNPSRCALLTGCEISSYVEFALCAGFAIALLFR